MTLDEATAALMARIAEARPKPVREMTPQEARQFAAGMRPPPDPGPEMANVLTRRVPVTGGTVPVRILVPGPRPDGVIVYYHGGGWVVGSIDQSELLGRRLAQRSGCVVVLVGYRLAPEYRFPTAVDDSYAALCWVDRHIEEVAGRRVPLIVAGESSGGNLAAVMAQKARDHRDPALAMQVLVYPVLDCDFDTTSYVDPANSCLLTREDMFWFWDQYAPDPAGRTHPDASPLRAGDLSELPTAVVLTAEHDVLRTEGEIYATRLVYAGVKVTHQRCEGQMHGFFTMLDALPGSEVGISYVVEAIRQHLVGPDRVAT
jgi:acetyl esterase